MLHPHGVKNVSDLPEVFVVIVFLFAHNCNGHRESNHNTILDMEKMQKNTWIIRYIDSNNTIQVGLMSWDMRSRPKK